MGRLAKTMGIVLLSATCFVSVGVYASESGHGAAGHMTKSMSIENTAPGVRAMYTEPPLAMFEPASTATPPTMSVLFPAIAASLGILLAIISATRRAKC